jgi:hypothetical protein
MESIRSGGGNPRRVFWHEFVAWQERASEAELEQLEASLQYLATLACRDALPVDQAIELALNGEPVTRGIPGSLRERLATAHWPPTHSAC